MYVSARTKDTEWQKCVPPLCLGYLFVLVLVPVRPVKGDALPGLDVHQCQAGSIVSGSNLQRLSLRILNYGTKITYPQLQHNVFSSVLVDFVDRKTEINLFQTGDDLWLWSDCSPIAGVCQSYMATLLSECNPVTEAKLYKIEDQDIERHRAQGWSKYCENWNLNGNLNLSLSSKRLLYSVVIHLINFRGYYLKRKRRNLLSSFYDVLSYSKESR